MVVQCAGRQSIGTQAGHRYSHPSDQSFSGAHHQGPDSTAHRKRKRKMNFDLKGKIVVVQRAKSSGIMRQRSNSQFAILQVLALALFVAAQATAAQPRSFAKKALSPRVLEQTFHSKALNREMHYMIVLPADYGGLGGL